MKTYENVADNDSTSESEDDLESPEKKPLLHSLANWSNRDSIAG